MKKKRVLAISGSLRRPSFTEKMLDLCIEGMGSEVHVQTFHPHRMNIGPCTGCWTCWRKTPGVCVKKDDFRLILDAYKKADYFLLAAPLYVFDFPATVKNVLDRFFVVLDPAQVKAPWGGTVHPKRVERHPRTALISSCGFPEVENFALLREHFRVICKEMEWVWAGEVLISASGLANAPGLFARKYELIRQAGVELLEGAVRGETTAAIARPVMSHEDYRKVATAAFHGGAMARITQAAIVMKNLLAARGTGYEGGRNP